MSAADTVTHMTTHPEHLLARAADGTALTAAERSEVDRHLDACAACREALEAQRLVARVLQGRLDMEAAPDFPARVSARLDASGAGMLELANWRAWTVGLTPIAAALVMVAYLGVGAPVRESAAPATTTAAAPVTFETWASASAGSTPAAVFLQPSASGEQLLETVLIGGVLPAAEPSNVR